MFLSCQWGHWIFCLAGGGGDVVIGYSVFFVLFIVVLVLVVCSIFSLFRILVVFCF